MEQSEAGPRCREAVVVSKQLLAGETVHYRSDTLVVDGVTLLTPPRPDLRVYLAGRGPYILKAAGEVADGAIIGGLVSPSGISYALQMVRDGARSKGRDAGKMDMIWWGSCYLTDDRQAIVDQLKSSVAHIIGGAPISVLQTIGLSDGRIDQLKKKYVAEGPAGAATLVTEEEIDLFSIVGDGKECSDKIAGLEKAGINQIGLLLNQPTAEAQQSFLRQFASEVIPYFR
jgi:5,10-methylenetetrahydromethanopterin reductase